MLGAFVQGPTGPAGLIADKPAAWASRYVPAPRPGAPEVAEGPAGSWLAGLEPTDGASPMSAPPVEMATLRVLQPAAGPADPASVRWRVIESNLHNPYSGTSGHRLPIRSGCRPGASRLQLAAGGRYPSCVPPTDRAAHSIRAVMRLDKKNGAHRRQLTPRGLTEFTKPTES